MRADSANDIATVKSEIKTTLPKATVTTAADLADQVSGSLTSASQLADTLGKWLAIAALVAAFAVASLLTVSAVSRRVREFGTLKALGWRSRRIVGQVLGESVVQGVVGGVLGVALGVAGARLIAALLAGAQGDDGQTRAAAGGPGGPAPRGMTDALGDAAQTVTVHLTAPGQPAAGRCSPSAWPWRAACWPARFGGWRASRLRPADALRRVD